MKALYLKEIRGFLGSLIGYAVIGTFLILNSLFLWVFSFGTNILEGGTADLVSYFTIAPIIFLILIPAITMRSFSEEKRTGTIELLYTRPLTDMQIILAKYFAGLTLVIIAVLPTIIYYISIHFLGNPVGNIDDGVTISSYIGLILVGGVFVSIGIFVSSLTENQIVALILAVFLTWFIYLGFDILATYSQFGGADYFIRNLGVLTHFTAIQKGVLVLSDLVYFISCIVVFILATKLVLQSRKW
ncbi:gliding motility-associated ABC transporter permease subunit GldF [Putridiphycobacter roseus]|uniref:Gliding motility-associated ABC transporter permease subunit GldF n=1 Tax=Putridiphycobacter roseus TaxID=2219161 RepID=A0A2W1NBY2_9FLAO|nr:gliding motility-associated ABC transporter permease subunit GldF [Putridiphycobacter roseus]PZE16845.1 gliding motility-associated ABC transporter permease subunit GldF [Putridiphycobacter roseus]